MVRAIRTWEYELRPVPERLHPGPGQCGRSTAARIIKANRDVAQARTHLVSIGPKDSKRTTRLWKQLSKIEKRLAAANKYLAMCVGRDG